MTNDSAFSKHRFCSGCGEHLADAMKYCPGCGESRAGVDSSSRIVRVSPVHEEHEFYRTTNVVVTSSRAVFDGQTFSVANISSVRKIVDSRNAQAGGVLAVLGAIMAVGGFIGQMPGTGFLGLVLGLVGFGMTTQRHYWVALTTSGSEVKAYDAGDEGTADRIVAALNASIVHRG